MAQDAHLSLFDRQDVDDDVQNGNEITCRKVDKNDVNTILAIEQRVFDYPWTRDEFEYCIRESRCDGFVAERSGQIVGYVFFELRQRTIRLLSCAVVESERRRGVASSLLAAVRERLTERRAEISCVVRERNVVAQLFLRSAGFRALWIARSFYSAASEDAYKMIYQPERLSLFDRSEIEVPLPFAA